eukprot:CAMPEP_0113819866 /NCGR_PEP_ID=MMETSP0328-20130328/953_1 /TAXON_ID=39455 /ORGANISM="Alexandrium minutum" /LENGTH=104 /DNA_ID=CAMNT_0000787799 /DNA_START=705 /DNA_END=1016 /DNA_ORIENTATION=- /assembly_acc=CAM_ASM_000350
MIFTFERGLCKWMTTGADGHLLSSQLTKAWHTLPKSSLHEKSAVAWTLSAGATVRSPCDGALASVISSSGTCAHSGKGAAASRDCGRGGLGSCNRADLSQNGYG